MSTAASRPVSDALAIVVMGVSGAGKTTVGRALARALEGEFIDGDHLHSDAARAKMSAGEPLNDDDRWPWLDRVAARLADGLANGARTVVACSALRRRYRDRLRAGVGPRLRFIYLEADMAAMRARVGNRPGHYMPASLVESQFAALEPPQNEADVIAAPADMELSGGVADLAARLGGRGAPASLPAYKPDTL